MFFLLVSLLNVLAYILGVDNLDQLYHLSSDAESYNFLSFGFFSILKVVQQFSGLFIIPTSLIITAFFLKVTYTQNYFKNLLFQTATVFTFCLFFKAMSLGMLGEGVAFYMDKYLTWYVSGLFFVFSLFIQFLAMTDWSFVKLNEFRSKSMYKLSLKLQSFKKSFQLIGTESLSAGSLSDEYNNDQFSDMLINSKKLQSDDFFDFDDVEEIDETQEFESEPLETSSEKVEHAQVAKPRKKLRKSQNYFSQDSLIKTLISKDRHVVIGPDQVYFEGIISKLEEKLHDFKIDAKIINVLKGPVVDTFEVELGAGVKVSKVTGVAEDLSLALSGAPIRMIYPLMGKTTMGIEVPRNPREIIYLDDVLKTSAFRSAEKRLPVAMGKNAFGETTVVDLAAMPHMLVAGATGAGKSVYINTLLVSLLVKLSPEKLKLILIDPKQLELALYAKLPHLLMPVMTDPKSSSIALLWACQEMERRYTILKEMGVRNVEGFNKKLETSSKEDLLKIKDLYKEGDDYKLPYIVIIVDEFADLILSKCGKDIEVNICRLAAKARASGIHLVLATQRPSVDVITGLIKSNFPTRVSFRVTSPVDSRTILNSMGAEKLLGKGDMLYKHGVEMHRLHSSYVDEDEIEKFVESMCPEEPSYSKSALEFMEEIESGSSLDDIQGVSIQQTFKLEGKDELYRDAVNIITEIKACSASMLQRRLKIGYNRAANLVDQLEADGAIGPSQGSKPRKVLI